MWHQLDFNLSADAEHRLFQGRPRSPMAFRKLLAALSTKYQIGLPSQFFGYGQDGAPDPQAEITFSMGWSPNGLFILAIGSPSAQVLINRAGAINAALMHEAQALIPMHSRGGAHDAHLLPFPRRYFINNLSVGRQERNSFWMHAAQAVQAGSSWETEAGAKIAKSISRGLMRQAVYLAREGDDVEGSLSGALAGSLEGERPWVETGMEFEKRLNVTLHKVGGHTYVKDDHRTRLVLKSLEFTMQADLGGPWLVGRLKIEGQGILRLSSREWDIDTADKKKAA
jgi:hypothetical protein